MTEQDIPRTSSILKRLLFWFLIVSLVPLFIIGYITYMYSARALEDHILESYTAIAEARAHSINEYILEKEKDVAVFAFSYKAVAAMEELTKSYNEHGVDSLDYKTMVKKWKEFFSYYEEKMGYYDSFLISNNGEILYTERHEKDFGTNLISGPYKDSELARVFYQSKTLHETGISNFEWYAPSDEPAAFIAAPIIKGDNVIGTIAFQMSTEEIYNIVLDYRGLGKTGEMVVAVRVDNDAVFVAPLRHDREAAFNRKVALGSQEALPIQEAVQGKPGSSISIDYRGKEILAVWRYLPHIRWGLVVKIDTDEAYAPIYYLWKLLVVISAIAVCIVIAVTLFAAKSISNPIAKLTALTELISGGDMRFDIEVESKDEIGQLAKSFNTMMHNLDKAQKELISKEKFATIGRISGSIAHDVRHPLATIKNSAYFLNMTLNDQSEKTKKHIKLINNEVAYANEIITSLMRLSESKEPERIKTNLEEFVREFFSVSPLPERVKLVTEYDNECPDILVDRSHLKLAFNNLTSNAKQAMPEDGTLTIKTCHLSSVNSHLEKEKQMTNDQEPMAKKDFVEISFADTGHGMKNEILDKVFEPFYTTKNKGIGLGLSIVNDVITANNGNISVESEEDKGSTFKIVFPAAED